MIEKRGRGRPRPLSTIERDEAVFMLLSGEPKSRQQLADYLDVNINVIYLSLTRLSRAGRAVKVRDGKYHRWTQFSPN